MVESTGIPEFKDFEEREKPLAFRIGTQEYFAVPSIGIGSLAEMTGLLEQLGSLAGIKTVEDVQRAITTLQSIFTAIMLPESAERLNARLIDKERPIGFKTITNVINWLFEQYGLRPTQPSAPFSGTDGDAASTSSTPGAPSTAQVTGLTGLPGES